MSKGEEEKIVDKPKDLTFKEKLKSMVMQNKYEIAILLVSIVFYVSTIFIHYNSIITTLVNILDIIGVLLLPIRLEIALIMFTLSSWLDTGMSLQTILLLVGTIGRLVLIDTRKTKGIKNKIKEIERALTISCNKICVNNLLGRVCLYVLFVTSITLAKNYNTTLIPMWISLSIFYSVTEIVGFSDTYVFRLMYQVLLLYIVAMQSAVNGLQILSIISILINAIVLFISYKKYKNTRKCIDK